MPKLTDSELVQVRQMAESGLRLEEIRASLGYSSEEFGKIQDGDPRIVDAFNAGRADGMRAVSDALLRSTVEGDVSAARLLLRRIENGDAEVAETIGVKDRERLAGQAAVVVPRVAAALERQRKLRAGMLDVVTLDGLSEAEKEALWHQGKIGRIEDGKGNVVRHVAFGGKG